MNYMPNYKDTRFSPHWTSILDTITLDSHTAPNQKQPFIISGMGKYEFNRVPFGLAQAPAHFQKLINEVLTDCNFTMGYLDDIIIFSKTGEEHLEHLESIFNRLREAGLKLKLQKGSFFKKHIQYLGHLISDEGIQPLPEKLESIAKNANTQECKTGKTVPRTC